MSLMPALQSLDYAKLIQTASFNYCGVALGKTQINKILFYVYGVYYAITGNKLFEDDTPQAWTYGPVFPRVYKKIIIGKVTKFNAEEQKQFMQDNTAFKLICNACKIMPLKTAVELTDWSHEEGTPWYNTIYTFENGVLKQQPWGTIIKDEQIGIYFKDERNRIFGSC